jgi:hypothetical protein
MVVALTGITVSAVGHLHLQGRVSAARLEGDLVMERSAALAASWLSRLGRSAESITATDRGLSMRLFDGEEVELIAENRRLIEVRGGTRTAIARHIDHLKLEEQPGSWVLEIHATRPLVDGAEHRRTRSVRIPRWR